MYASDATCGQETQSCHTCTEHGPGHCRRSPAARCQGNCQVAPAYLDDILRCSQVLKFAASETNTNLAIVYTHSCRDRVFSADGFLHGQGRFDVDRIGQAVGNNG